MALRVSRNNDGTGPVSSTESGIAGTAITKTVVLDGTGGAEVTAAKTFYLFANGARYYDAITIEPVSEETGINYQVSLDNTTWAESVTPADMDALLTDQHTVFYIRASVTNDGGGDQPATGTYTGAKVRVTATELEEAPA